LISWDGLSPDQVRNQIETLLFSPMSVTRAALPVMRKQRSGLLLTLSSTAGITGQMFCTAYAAAWSGMNGKQGGDPAKLANAIVQLAGLAEPPARFAAGADSVQTLEGKAKALFAQANAYRDLSSSLAHSDG
jgi:hypothetical protein